MAALEPIVDHQESRPKSWVFITRIFDQFQLRPLQSDRPRYRRVFDLAVKVQHEIHCRLIVDVPQSRQGASGPRLDCHTRKAQSRSVIAGGGVARA